MREEDREKTSSSRDRFWMEQALQEAERSLETCDIPIACLIVADDVLLAAAHNAREAQRDATAHAEILAIRAASARLGTWHLENCTLYVTLEPCPMCAGAILEAQLGRLVFAARSPKSGAIVSRLHLPECGFPAHPQITEGVCAAESAALLRRFFQEQRSQQAAQSRGQRRQAALQRWRERQAELRVTIGEISERTAKEAAKHDAT